MAALDPSPANELQAFTDARAAIDRITEIYQASIQRLRARIGQHAAGARLEDDPRTVYPYLGIEIGPRDICLDSRLSYGSVPRPGRYGTTVTRPDLFRAYLLEQLELLLRNHGKPVLVGRSGTRIPVTFVGDSTLADLPRERIESLAGRFALPDLSRIDDSIANGTFTPDPDRPLSLFPAERTDLSLMRLSHYTGTEPGHFQRFVLFTNYQRYVDEFVAYGKARVAADPRYRCFVEPGNAVTSSPALAEPLPSGSAPRHLPQMPAYHLVAPNHSGITLVNIGIGPSNAKTITDHIAVLRPHCWLMIGHCGGLRMTQRLGDYVLAHAYVRGDHVLDEDLPSWVPVPPIAEVQIALAQSVSEVTRLRGRALKSRLRTGTVYTTDDRDWELRHDVLAQRFNQSRAIAVDMESGTVAANGFRFRVPYGTLLCVSDKPLHGEVKLPGMANAFYQQSISQHLRIALTAIRILKEASVNSPHSRKLRSFDEPAFR